MSDENEIDPQTTLQVKDLSLLKLDVRVTNDPLKTETAQQNWEYYTLAMVDQLQGALNAIGKQGWELVCYAEDRNLFIFKRPIK